MGMIANLYARLLLDDSGFEQSVVKSGTKAGDKAGAGLSGKLNKHLDAVGVKASSASGLFGKLGNATGGLVTPTTLVASAVLGLTGGLIHAASAAADEQKNIARLSASLKANVPDWDGNTAAIERTIASREALAFSDDELRNSLARLVGSTHDVNKALALQATAMDLARFAGISLDDASGALIKVENGQFRALKGLGINLKDFATQTEAVAAVQKIAGGQAKAFADANVGAYDALQIALSDVEEEIGGALLPAMKEFATWLRADGIKALQEFGGALGAILGGVGDLWHTLNDPFGAKDHFQKGIDDTAAATAAANAVFDKTYDALEESRVAFRASVTPVRNYGRAAEIAASRFKDLNEAIHSFFTTPELAGDAAQAAQNIADLHKQQRELNKSYKDGKITKAEYDRQTTILNGSLATEKERLLGIQVEQAKLGNKPAKDTISAWLRKEIALWGTLTDAQKEAVLYAARYADRSSGKTHGRSPTRTASGGRRSKGELTLVGEDGPELRVEPSDAVYYSAPKTRAILHPWMPTPYRVADAAAQAASQAAAPSPVAMAARGENHFHYDIQVEGLLKARTPMELSANLQRLANFGALSPPEFRDR